MLACAGEKFDDGESIAEYADVTAPTYWDEPHQREDGPKNVLRPICPIGAINPSPIAH